MDDVYGSGPVLHGIMGAREAELRWAEARAAIERVETRLLLDEYRSLPVGNRLAANYWALRASASPIAIAAHLRASATKLSGGAAMLRRHGATFGPVPAEARA